jgi:hypothetical protein
MCAQDRDSTARGGDINRVVLKNLCGLLDHLDLLLVVSRLLAHLGVVREQVEQQGPRKDGRDQGLVRCPASGLLFQLAHRSSASARGCLIRGHDDAGDRGDLVNEPNSHVHDNGGAVWICNDPLVLFCRLGIDFGNHQRDVWMHPVEAGIVDDHASRFHSSGCKLLALRSSSAEESYVDIFERIFSKLFNGSLFTPVEILQSNLLHFKRPLFWKHHAQKKSWKCNQLMGH